MAAILVRYATAALWIVPAATASRPLVPMLIFACVAAEASWFSQRVLSRRSVRDPALIAADVLTCVGLIAVIAATRVSPGPPDGLAWAFPFVFGTCVIVGLGLGTVPVGILGATVPAVALGVANGAFTAMFGAQLTVLAVGYRLAGVLASCRVPQASNLSQAISPEVERIYREIHGHLLPIVDAAASGVPLTAEWTSLAAWEAARARRLLLASQDVSGPDSLGEVDPGGFGARMSDLRDTFTEVGMALSVVLRIAADPPAAPGVAASYAAREALTNVLKHAGPHCETHLYAESADDRLEIVVTDRGPGFDPEAVVPRSGLARTYGAVRQLGGAVDITSAPGAGTRIRVRWPASPKGSG